MDMLDATRLEKLHETLTGAARATVFAHTHPDGDAIGCTVALALWMKEHGVDARVVLPDKVTDNLAFMTRTLRPADFSTDPDAGEWIAGSDLLVCMDCNAFDRTSPEMETALRANTSARKVLIDHHLDPDISSFDLVFSTPDISSASELTFWILMEMPEIQGDAAKLSTPVREALLTGMTTDTNNFANSVFPSTLEMASKLLAAGTDRDKILCFLYNQYRENRLRLMGTMLKDQMVITPEGVAYMLLPSELIGEYDIRPGETEGFVNIPLAMAKVRMSLLLKEEGGLWRVSIRSKRGTSANKLAARYFHGGGHELASGGKLRWPEDIPSRGDAGRYIERATRELLAEEDEA